MEKEIYGLEEFIALKDNYIWGKIKYENVLFHARIGRFLNYYSIIIWDNRECCLFDIEKPNDEEVTKEEIKQIKEVFDMAIKGITCCSECHKPLFIRPTMEKINDWVQIWAGFYCDKCKVGKDCMDTTGD